MAKCWEGTKYIYWKQFESAPVPNAFSAYARCDECDERESRPGGETTGPPNFTKPPHKYTSFLYIYHVLVLFFQCFIIRYNKDGENNFSTFKMQRPKFLMCMLNTRQNVHHTHPPHGRNALSGVWASLSKNSGSAPWLKTEDCEWYTATYVSH